MQWAHFICLGTPNGLGSFLERPIFDPFFVPKAPIFKAFWDSRRTKTGHHELKMRQKHLFWHFMWSKIIFEKSLFLHLVDLVGHFGTHLFGLPLATFRGPLGAGTGVLASVSAILGGGNHQKWVVASGLGALEIMF